MALMITPCPVGITLVESVLYHATGTDDLNPAPAMRLSASLSPRPSPLKTVTLRQQPRCRPSASWSGPTNTCRHPRFSSLPVRPLYGRLLDDIEVPSSVSVLDCTAIRVSSYRSNSHCGARQHCNYPLVVCPPSS